MADKDPFRWPPEEDPQPIPVADGQEALFDDASIAPPNEDEGSSNLSLREGNQV